MGAIKDASITNPNIATGTLSIFPPLWSAPPFSGVPLAPRPLQGLDGRPMRPPAPTPPAWWRRPKTSGLEECQQVGIELLKVRGRQSLDCRPVNTYPYGFAGGVVGLAGGVVGLAGGVVGVVGLAGGVVGVVGLDVGRCCSVIFFTPFFFNTESTRNGRSPGRP